MSRNSWPDYEGEIKDEKGGKRWHVIPWNGLRIGAQAEAKAWVEKPDPNIMSVWRFNGIPTSMSTRAPHAHESLCKTEEVSFSSKVIAAGKLLKIRLRFGGDGECRNHVFCPESDWQSAAACARKEREKLIVGKNGIHRHSAVVRRVCDSVYLFTFRSLHTICKASQAKQFLTWVTAVLPNGAFVNWAVADPCSGIRRRVAVEMSSVSAWITFTQLLLVIVCISARIGRRVSDKCCYCQWIESANVSPTHIHSQHRHASREPWVPCTFAHEYVKAPLYWIERVKIDRRSEKRDTWKRSSRS